MCVLLTREVFGNTSPTIAAEHTNIFGVTVDCTSRRWDIHNAVLLHIQVCFSWSLYLVTNQKAKLLTSAPSLLF